MHRKIIAIIISIIVLVTIFSLVKGKPINPPVANRVQWDSTETKQLFARACADCHSNNTKWPWYSAVAPVALMIEHNVEEGRSKFNVSSPEIGEPEEAAEELREGEMPPWDYLLLHPEARLSEREKSAFVKGLNATFGYKDEHDEYDD